MFYQDVFWGVLIFNMKSNAVFLWYVSMISNIWCWCVFCRTINLLTHASRAIWDLFCSSFSFLLFALALRARANNYGKKMTRKINLILHSEACVDRDISTKYRPISTKYRPISTKYRQISTKYRPIIDQYRPILTNIDSRYQSILVDIGRYLSIYTS